MKNIERERERVAMGGQWSVKDSEIEAEGSELMVSRKRERECLFFPEILLTPTKLTPDTALMIKTYDKNASQY